MEVFLDQLSQENLEANLSVIVAATESPGMLFRLAYFSALFSFGEFLDHPAVERMRHGPYSQYFDLLNLFCYGTFESYSKDKDKFPPLSQLQIRKLRQLSIITESHSRKFIPYALLFEKLGLSSSRELEDLVIELFYLEVLNGKLDQQRSLLLINSAIGRDVRVEEFPELSKCLDVWLEKVESTLHHISKNIQMANNKRMESELRQKAVDEAANSAKEAVRNRLNKLDAEASLMDVDDRTINFDLLPDGRLGPSRQVVVATDNPCGDRDSRARMTMFKGLRKNR